MVDGTAVLVSLLAAIFLNDQPRTPRDHILTLRESTPAHAVVETTSGRCVHESYSIGFTRRPAELVLRRNGVRLNATPAANVAADLQRIALIRVGMSCDRALANFDLFWVRMADDTIRYRSARIVVYRNGGVRSDGGQDLSANQFWSIFYPR
jgi:hypothetical protein